MNDRNLSGLKILLIDDEKGICEILQESFKTFGAEVFSASNGSDGLNLYEENKNFDIILTDIRMPGMNGKELTQKLRAGGCTTPIICMSGYSEYEENEVLSWGASAMIHKPANMDTLFAVLKSVTR